jgi:hypothetical protein
MAFSKEEIDSLKNILQNADDKLLFELFGDTFHVAKQMIKEKKRKDLSEGPYQFHQRFSDL